MALVAELRLFDDLLLYGETFERVPDAVLDFEDVHYVRDEDGSIRYVHFAWVSGCAFDEFERALDADPTVADFRTVTTLDGRRLYRIDTTSFPPEQPLVYPAFREHDVTTVEVTRDAAGLHVRARFRDRDALRAFLDSGAAVARNVEVSMLRAEQSVSAGTPGTAGGDVLTRKQREALSLASERGYFETPSQVTLSDLAEEFGVTPQTLSVHIRVGVQKLVADAVSSGDGPPTDPGVPLEDTSQ